MLSAGATLALLSCGQPSARGSEAAATPAVSASAAAQAAGGSSAAAKPASSGAATAKPAAASLTTVRLAAQQSIPDNVPVSLSKNAGLWARNGLNVDLQSLGGTIATKQLMAGQLEAMITAPSEAMAARAAGFNVTIVGVLQDATDLTLMAPASITSIDQIRGKTMGVISRTGGPGVVAIAALHKYGLEPDKDYKVIETGSTSLGAGLAAALLAHNVDVATLSLDLVRQVTASGGFHVLLDLPKTDLHSTGETLSFRSDYVSQHPTQVQATLDTLLQGIGYFKAHPDEAKALIASISRSNNDPDYVGLQYDRQLELIAKDPLPRPERYSDLLSAVADVVPDAKSLDMTTFVEPRFAQSAVDRGVALTR
jgi:NitT/TauT family transport system substrate-binding protein